MYLGFIMYETGDVHHWICKDWKEMVEYCKELRLKYSSLNEDEPLNEYYLDLKDGSFINIVKASDYSIKQAKEYESSK
jgi:hypothetical protein